MDTRIIMRNENIIVDTLKNHSKLEIIKAEATQ